MVRICALFLLLGLSAGKASAVPITYAFSGQVGSAFTVTPDPVPTNVATAVSNLFGQAISGTFIYDNAVPMTGTKLLTDFPGSVYDGAFLGLTADVGGNAIAAATGEAFVKSTGIDMLGLGAYAVGTLAGFDVVSFSLVWEEGTLWPNPLPSFLANDALPALLPTWLPPQILITLNIPGLTSINPGSGVQALVIDISGTLIAVGVPEPTTFTLLGLGLLIIVGSRRRAASIYQRSTP